MKFSPIEFIHLLSAVDKPARYINREINSYNKQPGVNTVNFCLVYPDVYEIGFSHLGIKIIYAILNREDDAIADRAYAPWPDFGALLQKEKIPLFGIESKVALKDFDVLGFTLQSELTYTNILYILDLADIPILRNQRQDHHPLLLAGGPNTTNPTPLEDFFDVFLIGDGEEAVLDLKNILKARAGKTRTEKLEAISRLPGFHVPALQNDLTVTTIRKFQNLDDPKYQYKNQLIPWVMPTHYRYVTEIMRGCSRGCRFCHAGMYYRPVREKNPTRIIDDLLHEMQHSGWEEAALTSLSSSDYTCIREVLLELYKRLPGKGTSLSLPSLRVDSLDENLIALINSLRQTGLTIAPEAGSQRLRNIINKNISESEILEGVRIALENGWKLLKLYFMIGLPEENEQDIDAIIELINKLLDISHRRLQLNISISPFVPKTFTPFQWSGMNSRDELERKSKKIKDAFSRLRFVKISYHDPDSSTLECIIGRGDHQVGKLIHTAYLKGARFDGWKEHFRISRWQDSAEEIGLDLNAKLMPIPLQADLPWDKIDLGISKEFLLKEFHKAQQEETSEDCRNGNCQQCGICDADLHHHLQPATDQVEFTPGNINLPSSPNTYYYRVFYAKSGDLRFVGHLDLIRMVQNILRSTDLPISYSTGYNIHPRLKFGPPLPSGVSGEKEFFDLALEHSTPVKTLSDKLLKAFRNNLKYLDVIELSGRKDTIGEQFEIEHLKITGFDLYPVDHQSALDDFLQAEQWHFRRTRKGREQLVDLKDVIMKIYFENNCLHLSKKIRGASVFDLLREIFKIQREETGKLNIIRYDFNL